MKYPSGNTGSLRDLVDRFMVMIFFVGTRLFLAYQLLGSQQPETAFGNKIIVFAGLLLTPNVTVTYCNMFPSSNQAVIGTAIALGALVDIVVINALNDIYYRQKLARTPDIDQPPRDEKRSE